MKKTGYEKCSCPESLALREELQDVRKNLEFELKDTKKSIKMVESDISFEEKHNRRTDGTISFMSGKKRIYEYYAHRLQVLLNLMDQDEPKKQAAKEYSPGQATILPSGARYTGD